MLLTLVIPTRKGGKEGGSGVRRGKGGRKE